MPRWACGEGECPRPPPNRLRDRVSSGDTTPCLAGQTWAGVVWGKGAAWGGTGSPQRETQATWCTQSVGGPGTEPTVPGTLHLEPEGNRQIWTLKTPGGTQSACEAEREYGTKNGQGWAGRVRHSSQTQGEGVRGGAEWVLQVPRSEGAGQQVQTPGGDKATEGEWER